MATGIEAFQLKPETPPKITSDRPALLFKEMEHSYPSSIREHIFTPVPIQFGDLDFMLSATTRHDEDNYEEFYSLELKCRIQDIKEFNWLKNYRLKFIDPRAAGTQHALTDLSFDNPVILDDKGISKNTVEDEIAEKGFADLYFRSSIYDFPFYHEMLRPKIETILIDKRVPSNQQKLPLLLE